MERSIVGEGMASFDSYVKTRVGSFTALWISPSDVRDP